MTEQGLTAKIIPVIDDQAIQEFASKITQGLGSVSVPIGNSSGGGDGSGGGADALTGMVTNDTSVLKKAVKEGNEEAGKTLEDDPNYTEKKNKTTKEGLGALATKGTAIIDVALSGVNQIMNVIKFLENSSPPLRNVMSLFEQAFSLIWMPMGTVIAVQLMPVLRDVMGKIASWVGIAFKLYEEKGMIGLIRGAIELTFDVLMDLLTQDVVWQAIFALLWGVFKMTWIGQLMTKILGDDGYWEILPAIGKTIGDWVAVWDDKIVPIFNKMGDVFRWMWDTLRDTISDISAVIQRIAGFLGNLGEGAVGGVKDAWNSSIGSVTGLKWNAEGGVATRPTITGVGEAGPEAIIPLNQFSNIMNEYNSSIGGTMGGNVITININGASDPMRTGEEVQRVLEKTVGKASSKLMWW